MPSPHGACPYMHLRCVNCRQPVALPDGFDRYFDMPARCHACRRVFTVPPQRPGDNAASDGRPERPLDRSVSARRHHHEIRCEACAVTLGLPGSRTPEMAVDLSCPACGAGFRHRRRAPQPDPDRRHHDAGAWSDSAGPGQRLCRASQPCLNASTGLDWRDSGQAWNQVMTAAIARLV